jgi:hypothetical protein
MKMMPEAIWAPFATKAKSVLPPKKVPVTFALELQYTQSEMMPN